MDSFSNLNRLAMEYEDIKLLVTVPDLILVSVNPVMLEQVREILRIDYDQARFKQLLGYDTQFGLGDFYVSWLCIRDIRFRNIRTGSVPIIPAVMVIHERKLGMHHEMAWMIMTDLIPEISTKKHLATSDDEFTALMEKFVKNGFVAKCENHGTQKIKRWVKNHGGKKDDILVLPSDFRYLIRCKSMNEYQTELNSMMIRWPQPFITYFIQHIHPEIEKFALWTMKAWNFPVTEDSVLTSNQCEAINRMNAEQQDWKEMPADKAFLIGRDLQKAKVTEMARGMMNTGNYELLPEFRVKYSSKVGEDLVRRMGSTPSFDMIVSRHKEARDVTRHAGRGTKKDVIDEIEVHENSLEDLVGDTEVDVNTMEEVFHDVQVESCTLTIDGELVDVNQIVLETDAIVTESELNTSKELQEVAEEFDIDDSNDAPVEEEIEESFTGSQTPSKNPSLLDAAIVSPDTVSVAQMLSTPVVGTCSSRTMASTSSRSPCVLDSVFLTPAMVPVTPSSTPAINCPSSTVSSTPIATSSSMASPSILSGVDPITDADEITFVPSLDAYFSPGRLFPVSVQLKKNLCNQCGYRPRKNWCIHLRRAGLKAGMEIAEKTPVLKSLTQLRKNQRADKTKSGKKAPRRFDIIPLHKELNNDEASESIQLRLAESQPAIPRSNVDDVINSVVNQAYEQNKETEPLQSKRRLSFVDESDVEIMAKRRKVVTESDSEDDFRLVLDDTPVETLDEYNLKVTFVVDGLDNLKDIPKSRRAKQVKPIYLNSYNVNLLPNKR